MPEGIRAQVVWYAEKFIGAPYRWGGDDPMAGFDCSGFVVECLASVGILDDDEDLSAAALFQRFRKVQMIAEPGDLVFWASIKSPLKITHVEIALDSARTIGASGGGSTTVTIAEAIIANAYVKVRPIDYRGRNYAIINPYKEA